MKTHFIFLIFTAAFFAVTMSSCDKDEELLRELEINLNDNTEISVTVQIRDYQTSNVIAGAVIKDEKGVTVAVSDEKGMAICTKKAGDKFIYTIEAAGYASIWSDIFGEDRIIAMSKLDAKLRGIATYTDKSGNLSVVSSGTNINITLSSQYIQNEYTVKVGAEGIFEFANLPYGAYCVFTQIAIGSDKYEASQYRYITAGGGSVSIHYSPVSDELPFVITSFTNKVSPTGDIVIQFTRAIDLEYSNIIAYYSGGQSQAFSKSLSSDNKTLTLTPNEDMPWGTLSDWYGNVMTYGNFDLRMDIFTPVNMATGQRESIYRTFNIQIIE